MAKEASRPELYEILAEKRAQGKKPLTYEPHPVASPIPEEPSPPTSRPTPTSGRGRSSDTSWQEKAPEPTPEPVGIIIDTSLESQLPPVLPVRDRPVALEQSPVAPPVLLPARVEPRVRSPREVVVALDTAFIIFLVVLVLSGSAYFLGYKRGQEEKPIGPSSGELIDSVNPEQVSLRELAGRLRPVLVPPDQDYTLVLRTEPAVSEIPERLELELSEAVALGAKNFGAEIPAFIFRNTKGDDVRFILAVGLGRGLNDPDLNRLLQIYNQMEGVTLSREPRPYIGCQIAPVRELGTPLG
ncbi:MAG: hypothetical protein LBU79_03955 [Planctomycetota bacterium]|nr:hypothetical protein [Planctomycetota bacterium]